MSNEITVVPDAARDANLTPTQRFELITRSQQGMESYQAPRSTGEVTTRAGVNVTRVQEHAQYLNRCRDERGLVSAEQIVAGGEAFTHGYQLPAGHKFDPIEAYNMLSIAKLAKIPANYVFDFMVAFGRYFS